MPIQRLDEDLAQKIAAGEVIDRPASVVKELVENAIDAESESIEIEVREGGISSIVVRDDGVGMDEVDLGMCAQRHATSKIATAADLLHIRSLGFRGEALASISAVAHVRILSRVEYADEACVLSLEPGGAPQLEPAARGPGTTVEVRDLFFNLPARSKFLGSPRTELLHINRLIHRLALVTAGTSWRLTSEGRETFAAPRVTNLLERLGQVYGLDVAGAMIPVEGQRGEIRVRGFVSRPDLKRGNRRDQLFVVNGRIIDDRGLGYVLASAYRGLLRPGSYPVAILSIDLPPETVDVNVHPRKEEVRFANVRDVQDALAAALHQALSSSNRVPVLGDAVFERPKAADDEATRGISREGPSSGSPLLFDMSVGLDSRRFADRGGKVRVESDRRVVGQLHDTYLLVEAPEGLEIIDQHIAHERILYERLLEESQGGGVVKQLFLLPARVELPFEAAAVLSANLENLCRIGVVLEEFGGGTFLVREYPQRLADDQTPRGFQQVVEALVEVLREGGDLHDALFDGLLRELACGAAIKAGERLPLVEAQALVDQLMRQQDPYSCPHGRPIIIRMDRQDLDRKFGR
jgi:DNA mismatch repair protein MutL